VICSRRTDCPRRCKLDTNHECEAACPILVDLWRALKETPPHAAPSERVVGARKHNFTAANFAVIRLEEPEPRLRPGRRFPTPGRQVQLASFCFSAVRPKPSASTAAPTRSSSAAGPSATSYLPNPSRRPNPQKPCERSAPLPRDLTRFHSPAPINLQRALRSRSEPGAHERSRRGRCRCICIQTIGS
jgi:hypothetical protein